jgi:hypothetical protein
MHLQFVYTKDELLDAARRFSARSKVVRSWRWKGLLYSGFMAWLLTFLLFFSSPLKGTLVGLLSAAIAMLLYPTLHERGVKKRLSKIIDERHGDAKTFKCEVELTPIGVWVRDANLQITYEWESVEEIKETEDSVDIYTKTGGGVIVRKRAFESPEKQKQFMELAEGYLELSCVGNSGDTPQLTGG